MRNALLTELIGCNMFTNRRSFCGCHNALRHVLYSVRKPILAAALFFCCASYGATAQQVQVTLDPSQTKIEWTLSATMHTVHGIFRLRSGVISFDANTGDASGELMVDATSGDSGNQTRDNKMNKDVLESKRYPEITFLAKRVSGKVPDEGASSLQVQGVFHIHGTDHELTLSIPVTVKGSSLEATTNFAVPYQAWGMKNPSTLFLRVDDKVQISIVAAGTITKATGKRTGH